MKQPRYASELVGHVDDLTISSDLLRGNPLGDPHERPLSVYTPPGYDDESDRRYPSVYVIQGYSGFVTSWFKRRPFRLSFPEKADAGKSTGGFGAMITPMLRPDLFGGLATHEPRRRATHFTIDQQYTKALAWLTTRLSPDA